MFISLPLLPSALLHFLQKSEKFSQCPELSLQTMPYSPLPSFLSLLFIWSYFVLRSSCFKEFTLQTFLQGWNSYSEFWWICKHSCNLSLASAQIHTFWFVSTLELPENNFTGNKQWEIVAYFMPPNQGNIIIQLVKWV